MSPFQMSHHPPRHCFMEGGYRVWWGERMARTARQRMIQQRDQNLHVWAKLKVLPRYRMTRRHQEDFRLRSKDEWNTEQSKIHFHQHYRPNWWTRKSCEERGFPWRLTFKNKMEGYSAAASSTFLLNASHGSAQLAQKLRHETRFKSFDRISRNCSGELTVINLLFDMST